MSRETAAEIVHKVLVRGDRADPLIAARAERDRLDAPSRAFLRELVFGTVRHHATLDHIIESFSSAPLKRIERRLLSILRVGLYQLLFLDHVAPEIAVDSAVSTARRRFSKRAGGFVNGVLRSIGRSMQRVDVEPDGTDPRRFVPGPEKSGILFDRDVLPSPGDDLDEHLAAAFSYPVELISRWRSHFGDEVCRTVARAGNARPRVGLRVHTSKVTREQLLAALTEQGFSVRVGPVEGSVIVDQPRGLFESSCHLEGWFQVQDPAAQRAVLALDPRAGESVLDLCAAPGGKATQIAERLGGSGRLVATDVDADRLKRLTESCTRLGLTGVDVRTIGRGADTDLGGPFDRVLLDVPCSNTGVLGRRPEARWRFDAAMLKSLTGVQAELLRKGAANVRPGGCLVYSTCSLESEENRDRVDVFLAENPGFRLLEDELTLPSTEGWDGGYWAKIKAPE
ncbi:MAG: transcription antitermination factor NusB [Planctomycetota bacterium]